MRLFNTIIYTYSVPSAQKLLLGKIFTAIKILPRIYTLFCESDLNLKNKW